MQETYLKSLYKKTFQILLFFQSHISRNQWNISFLRRSGVQNKPPQNGELWRVDNFELKAHSFRYWEFLGVLHCSGLFLCISFQFLLVPRALNVQNITLLAFFQAQSTVDPTFNPPLPQKPRWDPSPRPDVSFSKCISIFPSSSSRDLM